MKNAARNDFGRGRKPVRLKSGSFPKHIGPWAADRSLLFFSCLIPAAQVLFPVYFCGVAAYVRVFDYSATLSSLPRFFALPMLFCLQVSKLSFACEYELFGPSSVVTQCIAVISRMTPA